MRQLRTYKQPGMKVRRTEIMKLPYPLLNIARLSGQDNLSKLFRAPLRNEELNIFAHDGFRSNYCALWFIASTISKADTLSREFSRICEQTSSDILELERRKRDTNRHINDLKKALNNVKSVQERRQLMEKIMEYKETGQKEMPLLETSARMSASQHSRDEDEL
ncbi:protein fam227b-like isoform x2 [Plakobranchus ocellatus]|uniref:Protein fam227b-like isoform x2 n=1 Tax=Plakobranchus ocellatus TaxID=259542 RepID=A0AAV4A7W9_9GAST|nr:protein fam227b-like isoform x2 [Plakobranchus ocellatus]